MQGLLSRYRALVIVFVLVLLPLVLLYAQTKRAGARGPIVGVVVDVAALLEGALLWASGGVLDLVEHYVFSVGNHEELVALRRERESARALAVQVAHLEHQNEELRALSRVLDRIDDKKPLGARVVGRSGTPLSRLLRIDVGSADGVRRGDGVVDKDGVVGQVLAVGRAASDVLLLTDRGSAIDVTSLRTRARGVLRGAGDESYQALVEDFDKLRDVTPGDVLVTTGLGARFPPGLSVGVVLEASAPDDSLYLRAVVRPSARLAEVEYVSVLIGREVPRPRVLGTGPEGDVLPEEAPQPRQRAGGAGAPVLPRGGRVVDAGPMEAVDAGAPEAVDAGATAPDAADAGVEAEPPPADPAAAPAPPSVDGGPP